MLKTIQISIVFLFLSLFSFGHEYYFSYAEVEYNPFTQRFEASIEVTAHDLERSLESSGIDVNFDEELNDPELTTRLEAFLNKHFSFQCNGSSSSFRYVGHEIELTGALHLFLESDPMELSADIAVRYDLLMNSYENQQNKLSFINNGQKKTLSFLQHEKEHIIIIENQTNE